MSHHGSCNGCHLKNQKDEDTLQLFLNKSKDVLDIWIVPGDPNQAWIACYDKTLDGHGQKAMVDVVQL